MLVFVRRVILNDDDPDTKFIEAEIVFHDDEKSPHPGAEVIIFLAKNDKMTMGEVKAAAVEKARSFLLFAANFPPNKYHRKVSFESVPEEVF